MRPCAIDKPSVATRIPVETPRESRPFYHGWVILPLKRWLAAWKDRLLDCPHHHIVFTVAHELIPLWRYNKREFADTLFRAGIESLRELLADPKYPGALPGMLAALHTRDQTLLIHPHLHVMVTAGGLDGEGVWREAKKDCLLPRQVLMQVFRGKMRPAA